MTRCGPSTRALTVVGTIAAISILLVAVAAIWQTDRRDERASADAELAAVKAELADVRALLDDAAVGRAELEAKVDALVAQLEQLGVEPVTRSDVIAALPAAPNDTPSPQSTPGDERAPPPPETTPSTKRDCTVEVLGLCV